MPAARAMLESRALRGAVAQLGERRVRNAKVEGSIPFRSTIHVSIGIREDPKTPLNAGFFLGFFVSDNPALSVDILA